MLCTIVNAINRQPLDLQAFGHDEVEIEAALAATSVDGDELDALTQPLAALPAVRQAFWSPSTTE